MLAFGEAHWLSTDMSRKDVSLHMVKRRVRSEA